MNFYSELIKELLIDSENNFSISENYDQERFGKIEQPPLTLNARIRKSLEKLFASRGYTVTQKQRDYTALVEEKLDNLAPYMQDLEKFYNALNDTSSKKLMIQIMAFRILGFSKVKLPLNTPEFWEGSKEMERIADKKNFISANFQNWHLPFMDLSSKGIPLKLYFPPAGAYTDFVAKQYEYRNNGHSIKAQPGDTIIDAGGCWGDTALYFSNEIGETGVVYTYEFIPSNLEILKKNLSLNPGLNQRIKVIERPVWEQSGVFMYYIDNGPGSRVLSDDQEPHDGKAVTLSIDDLVKEYGIKKVDFIKMDIEGAEPFALKGAAETIRRFRPKLAIAIYHSINDFVKIPNFIDSLGLGYQLHLAHCSIHEEETILFAENPGS
jgi:FkbM family methyltransferase